MVGNYMYDVKHNESFLIGTNKEQYHSFWWDDGEPLWVTAEKQVLTNLNLTLIYISSWSV